MPRNSLAVRQMHNGFEVVGVSFTSQDGNSLLSFVAATCGLLDPNAYRCRIKCLEPYFFEEV